MKENFEEMIKADMQGYAEQIVSDPSLKERVNERIREERSKEMKEGKHVVSMRKIVIGVAIGCLFASTVAIAGSGIAGYVSHGSSTPEYKNYEDMPKAIAKLGYEVKTIETFSNGYTFKGVSVDQVEAIDENGGNLGVYDNLWTTYQNAAGEHVSYIVEKPLEEFNREETCDSSKEIAGVTVYYTSDNYKWVPVGYEPTEEEKQLEEQGELFISCGADEISTSTVQNVAWMIDGTNYSLLVDGTELTEQDLYKMAAEILE